jgi:hypothetical protein
MPSLGPQELALLKPLLFRPHDCPCWLIRVHMTESFKNLSKIFPWGAEDRKVGAEQQFDRLSAGPKRFLKEMAVNLRIRGVPLMQAA